MHIALNTILKLRLHMVWLGEDQACGWLILLTRRHLTQHPTTRPSSTRSKLSAGHRDERVAEVRWPLLGVSRASQPGPRGEKVSHHPQSTPPCLVPARLNQTTCAHGCWRNPGRWLGLGSPPSALFLLNVIERLVSMAHKFQVDEVARTRLTSTKQHKSDW